jgi:hypothetical protein
MRASEFVRQIKSQHGVEITAVNGGLKVQDLKKLPRFLQVAIAGHRQQLQQFLVNGGDAELSDRHRAEALEAMGVYQILVEEIFDGDRFTQKWNWTHDRGDDYLDQLLVGLLDLDDVAAERMRAEQASKEAAWSAVHPPLGRIFGRL